MPSPLWEQYIDSDLMLYRNNRKQELIDTLYLRSTQDSLKFRSTQVKINDSIK